MDKRVDITNRFTKAVKATVARQGTTTVLIERGADVQIAAPAHSVSAMVREGNDLVLHFDDGSVVRLEGYFSVPVQDMGQLSFADPAGAAPQAVHLGEMAAETTGSAASGAGGGAKAGATGGGFLGGNGLLVGLGAAGLGGAVAGVAGGGHGRGGSSGSGGGSDGGGSSGGTLPGTPVIRIRTGGALAGTADPGTTVAIDLKSDGTTDVTVLTDSNGQWSYTPVTPIADGTAVTVTAPNTAGRPLAPHMVSSMQPRPQGPR